MATYSPQQIADELGVSAKSLRRFMRTHFAERAGSGNRWALDQSAHDWIVENYGKVAVRRVVTLSVSNLITTDES